MSKELHMAAECMLFEELGPDEFEAALMKFAALVRADETKRADALAATIAALRDIVTSEAESKADFIVRVRNVLGACPDQRVLHAVEAEREACAKVCEGWDFVPGGHEFTPQQLTKNLTRTIAHHIRARSNT